MLFLSSRMAMRKILTHSLTGLLFVGLFLVLIPHFAHAGPQAGGGCGGTTWEHSYTIETNPFPPNTAGHAAWSAVYGESHVVESTYQMAVATISDEGCGEDVTVTTPTASMIAVPSTIQTGDSSYVSWNSAYTTSCTGTNFSTGGATSGSVLVSPSSSTTYSVNCTDGAQNALASTRVVVDPLPAPAVTLTATPGDIITGQQSSLSWTSTNAVMCTGTGFQTGGNTSGTVSTGPLNATTQYSVHCSGASSSSSSSTSGTPATSGTWQLSSTDISDLACPVTDANHVYADVPNCPGTPPPTGNACSGAVETCKVNRVVACNITTRIYNCVGASAGSVGVTNTTTTPGQTADAHAIVHVSPPPEISCSPSSATAAPGTPITWAVTPTQGSGSYTYSWSGTDNLSGSASSISKIYSTGGLKTASVTVNDTSVSTTPGSNTTTNTPGSGSTITTLEGGMQCSGGTLVARSGDTQDGVGFTLGTGGMSTECQNIIGSGNCCSVIVSEKVDSGGQPVNTHYSYTSYAGASLIPKESYSTAVGGNRTTYNFLGGMTSGGSSGGSSTTVTPSTTSTSGSSRTAICSAFVCSGDECTNPPPPPVVPPPPTIHPPVTPPSTGGGGTGGGTSGGGTSGGGGVTGGTPGASSISALLTAFPTTVVYGAPSVLSWASSHAVSCDGGNFSTGTHTSGTASVIPVATTLYSLTCTDASGNHAFSTATVNVIAPTLSISGSPQLVRSGDSTTITWSVSGHVDACSVSGPGLLSSAVSGSKSVVVKNESTFTLSCFAGALNSKVSTTVKILPTFQEK